MKTEKKSMIFTAIIMIIFLIIVNVRIFTPGQTRIEKELLIDLQYTWDSNDDECVDLAKPSYHE